MLDSYGGRTCIWFLCDPARRDEALARPGMFAAPYDKAGAALCQAVEALDWAAFEPLLRASYERAALT